MQGFRYRAGRSLTVWFPAVMRDRESNRKSGSLAPFTGDRDFPAMALDDPVDRRQSQASSVRAFGREKRLKTMLPGLGSHPRSRIDNADADVFSIHGGLQTDDPAGRHKVHRVDNEVGQQYEFP